MVKPRSEFGPSCCEGPCCYCWMMRLSGSRRVPVSQGYRHERNGQSGLATRGLGWESSEAAGRVARRPRLTPRLWCMACCPSQFPTEQQSQPSSQCRSHLLLSNSNHQTAGSLSLGCEGLTALSRLIVNGFDSWAPGWASMCEALQILSWIC